MHRLELPGATVNYAEIGEGEPIVFVHGLTSSWQNWLENLPHFGRTHRAIALDLPGFGASPMPSWPIDMPAYGRLLHDFCEKLGIGSDATLVGNSMGGLVAAEAVLARAEPLRAASSSSRPPGFINTWLPAPARQGDLAAPGTPSAAPSAPPPASSSPTPAPATRCSASSIRYPGRLRKELLWEQMASGVPCPGFADALDAVSNTTPATASKRSRSRP